MSVLSYLTQRASDAVLSGAEKDSISKSISTLMNRIDYYFESDVTSRFQFGSSTRGTILPRSMDENSDIDYMVIFKDDGSKPQTYLNRLKRFIETYYSRSEIYQSSPTIVLELNHIKFEIVPAKEVWGQKYIPDGNGDWMMTNPNDFNNTLTDKNKNNGNLIKPTIRLAKYWNARNGYVYSSYLLEKRIVELNFLWTKQNQRDFLFNVFDNISEYDVTAQHKKDKIKRAKEIVANVRKYESDSMPLTAEVEVKKLIPE